MMTAPPGASADQSVTTMGDTTISVASGGVVATCRTLTPKMWSAVDHCVLTKGKTLDDLMNAFVEIEKQEHAQAAQTTGDNSAAVTGDGNTVTINGEAK